MNHDNTRRRWTGAAGVTAGIPLRGVSHQEISRGLQTLLCDHAYATPVAVVADDLRWERVAV